MRPSNWLSTVNNAGDSFFCEEFNELLHRPRGPEGIRFVAFGYDGCFCVAHDGDCFWGYGAHWAYLKNVIERNQRGTKRIAVSVELIRCDLAHSHVRTLFYRLWTLIYMSSFGQMEATTPNYPILS